MTKRRSLVWLLTVAAVAGLLLALAPGFVRGYWSVRSSNPVRRGIARATELGCFSCHGQLGRSGIADPGASDAAVPSWSGGVWMMYVDGDAQIENYILHGTREKPGQRAAAPAAEEQAIQMPAYEAVLSSRDLEDLVAAFKVLAGMSLPPARTEERRGYDLARKWDCFSCHGAAGSGGLPNPASFAGLHPGWYGADFRDLVRNREEFDAWIRDGSIPRMANNRIASYFVRRQRVVMPAYENLTPADLNDLWAYVQWLETTDGGYRGGTTPW